MFSRGRSGRGPAGRELARDLRRTVRLDVRCSFGLARQGRCLSVALPCRVVSRVGGLTAIHKESPSLKDSLEESRPREEVNRWPGACRNQCSVTVGTIFKSGKLRLSTWLVAMHLLTQSRNSISALKRHLGLCYKTAWLLKHQMA
jgi:hypothetical protein